MSNVFVSCSIIEKGEEKCSDLIEAHKECMRALGFKIWWHVCVCVCVRLCGKFNILSVSWFACMNRLAKECSTSSESVRPYRVTAVTSRMYTLHQLRPSRDELLLPDAAPALPVTLADSRTQNPNPRTSVELHLHGAGMWHFCLCLLQWKWKMRLQALLHSRLYLIPLNSKGKAVSMDTSLDFFIFRVDVWTSVLTLNKKSYAIAAPSLCVHSKASRFCAGAGHSCCLWYALVI